MNFWAIFTAVCWIASVFLAYSLLEDLTKRRVKTLQKENAELKKELENLKK